MMHSMDLVQREEFEAVRDMATRAMDQNAALTARIEALEARLAAASAGNQGADAPKTRAAKPKNDA